MTATLTRVATLPVDYVMTTWRPGPHYYRLQTWANVMTHFREEGELHALAAEILREGIHDPVVLGGDGLVWNGTRRIIAAYMKGVREIPVTFAFV